MLSGPAAILDCLESKIGYQSVTESTKRSYEFLKRIFAYLCLPGRVFTQLLIGREYKIDSHGGTI